MGTITKGILGGFSGTVGTVIGGTWKGISYIRSRPSKRSGRFSQSQLEQQAKFSLVVEFATTMTGLLETTFKSFASKMSAFNNAVSYNIRNAITGTYPDFSINYSMALISRGDLPNASAPAATATGNTVFFTWTDNSGSGRAQSTDTALLVIYCKALKSTVYITAGQRSSGAANIDVSVFAGNTVETWLSFISADGKEVASSFYAGELAITG